jgi:preprotein translocase subunit SecE
VTKVEEENEKPKTTVKKTEKKPAVKPVNPVVRYLRETRGELKKVTWLTREESWRLTAIVLAVSALMAVFLWFWDLIFSQSIQWLIQVVSV